ncbi:hypothetical protein T484DRAFT_1789295, partial [Baffinella frigidus]
DVTLEELQGLYHAVVMSYGAEQDRVLGVPVNCYGAELGELQGLYHAVVMTDGAEQDRVLGVPDGAEQDRVLGVPGKGNVV